MTVVSIGCAVPTNFFGEPASAYHDVLRKDTRDASYFGLEKELAAALDEAEHD